MIGGCSKSGLRVALKSSYGNYWDCISVCACFFLAKDGQNAPNMITRTRSDSTQCAPVLWYFPAKILTSYSQLPNSTIFYRKMGFCVKNRSLSFVVDSLTKVVASLQWIGNIIRVANLMTESVCSQNGVSHFNLSLHFRHSLLFLQRWKL